MIPLFIGLSAANLLLLGIVLVLGLLTAAGAHPPTGWYPYHVALGLCAGLVTLLAHMTVFTYFMATSKWLEAATDKGNLDAGEFMRPAYARKGKAFAAAMAGVLAVMAAMFSGAGGDPTHAPLWPVEAHLWAAIGAVAVNVLCTAAEYRLIRQQGATIDGALAIINRGTGDGGKAAAAQTGADGSKERKRLT